MESEKSDEIVFYSHGERFTATPSKIKDMETTLFSMLQRNLDAAVFALKELRAIETSLTSKKYSEHQDTFVYQIKVKK